MEFFLILVLGAIVIWLASKRSADHQHVQQLYDLVSNLEDRLLRLERTQELKAASPRPEPALRVQYSGQPVDAAQKPHRSIQISRRIFPRSLRNRFLQPSRCPEAQKQKHQLCR
jgi:hypothetical protein